MASRWSSAASSDLVYLSVHQVSRNMSDPSGCLWLSGCYVAYSPSLGRIAMLNWAQWLWSRAPIMPTSTKLLDHSWPSSVCGLKWWWYDHVPRQSLPSPLPPTLLTPSSPPVRNHWWQQGFLLHCVSVSILLLFRMYHNIYWSYPDMSTK